MACEHPANGVMIQAFEWEIAADGQHWKNLQKKALTWMMMGITAAWLPPCYKGNSGTYDVGYGVYDLYDLGEFDQKGSISTKYGTRGEYLRAIESLKQRGIQVYADIVLNHKMGADKEQDILANKCEWGDHNKEGNIEKIKAATKFTFPQRHKRYSGFEWNWTHFTGIDINSATRRACNI